MRLKLPCEVGTQFRRIKPLIMASADRQSEPSPPCSGALKHTVSFGLSLSRLR